MSSHDIQFNLSGIDFINNPNILLSPPPIYLESSSSSSSSLPPIFLNSELNTLLSPPIILNSSSNLLTKCEIFDKNAMWVIASNPDVILVQGVNTNAYKKQGYIGIDPGTTFSPHGFGPVTWTNNYNSLVITGGNQDGTIFKDGDIVKFLNQGPGINPNTMGIESRLDTSFNYKVKVVSSPPPPNGQALLITCDEPECKDIYTVGLKTYNGPSRAVIFKGFGLSDNPNYGCECVNWDYTTNDCPALISQPVGIEKILDSNCITTQSYLKEVHLEDNVPHKYLVIPNCNRTSPNNRWKLSVEPNCCTQFYSVEFSAFNYPSRLVILVGDGLKNYPNIGCDCITSDKSCLILDNLPPHIDKVLDTTCTLSNPFFDIVGIPKDTPSKYLVIPDCTFSGIRSGTPQARWRLTVDPVCDAGGCRPCPHVINEACEIDYQFSINPRNHSTIFNTFSATTSYTDDELNTIKVGINDGNRGYQRDIGYVIEETPIIPAMPLGVKGVNYRNIGGINFQYPSDTYINVRNAQNNTRLKEHESWREDLNLFNKYSYTNLKTEEAGAVIPTNDDSDYSNKAKSYNIEYKGSLNNANERTKYKQTVVIKQFPEIKTGIPVFYAFNSGWASYDVTSGMNFKNVFSYAIQVVDKLTFTDGFIIEGEKTITGKNQIVSWIKSGLMPLLRTGVVGAFTSLSAYCLEGPECPEPPEQCTKASEGGGGLGGGPVCPIECWTGSNITGQEYFDWLTGTLAKYNDKQEFLKSNNVYGKIITGSIEAPFTILTGTLRYNNWVSGDKFKFTMYPFDYTGLYRALHLGNDPIYPPYNVELVYPRDWTNMYNFVDKLNEKLRDVSAPIWYPYICLSGTPSGYYADGPLMEFSVNTGSCCLPTGDLDILDFQNLIDFRSRRLLPGVPKTGAKIEDEDLCLGEIKGEASGKGRSPWYFQLKLDLASGDRRGYNLYSGYSYLVPTCIEFQRWESGNWRTVDYHCNLYKEITGLSPTCITREIPGIVESEDGYLDQNFASSVTGNSWQDEDLLLQLEQATGQAGTFKTLLNFQQKITVNSKGKCEGWVDVKDIDFIWPENFPTGIVTKNGTLSGVDNRYWCKPDEPEEKKGSCKCKPLPPKPDCNYPAGYPERFGAPGGYGPECVAEIATDEECKCKTWYCKCPTTDTPPVELCQIRTGWNFTGEFGLQAKSGNFDRYRIVLSNFSGQNIENYKSLQEFHIGNINLFSITGIPLEPLEGIDKCPIGANYIIDVQGSVPLRITGIHQYSISGNMSGKYSNYFEVTRPILEEERNIKFNKVSGRIVSDTATGFWGKTLTPTGWACASFDDYFFYDRANCEITFEKTMCAFVTGFTGLSGDFTALKQSVVNRELLVGGKFSNPIAFIFYTGSGFYTGILENVIYKDYDVVGYYPISGYITGYSVSGVLQTSSVITGFAPVNGDLYPYYPIASGFVSATGSVEIDYSKINNFDYFTIYGNNFVYHSDTSQFPSPSFFNNNDTLYQIISGISADLGLLSNFNNNIFSFGSLRTGVDGNSIITTTNTGAFKVFGMSGGKNLYPRIYNYYYVMTPGGSISGIEILPIVTGSIDRFILATGFYFSNSGTGTVTGNISTFTGVRYFTGVWDIATGNLLTPFESFFRYRWISGNSFIKNNTYNPDYLNYINARVFYLNQLSTFGYEEPDIVDFIINDRYNPDISGSGIIFRLSGVK
jgi:hypothetical protein